MRREGTAPGAAVMLPHALHQLDRVQLVPHFVTGCGQQIAHGGFHVIMPHEHLHGAQVSHSAAQRLAGIGTAEAMQRCLRYLCIF